MVAHMRLGYLVPEFPAQTHNFFWSEIIALQELGVETYLISTCRPSQSLMSHSWAATAQADTTYLAEPGVLDIPRILIELIKVGPAALLRAISAAIEGCPPKQVVYNLVLIVVAMRLVILLRRNGISHVHSHSCGRAALICMLANRLAGVSWQPDAAWRAGRLWPAAACQVSLRCVRDHYHEETANPGTREAVQDAHANIGLAPMGVNTKRSGRSEFYAPWDGSNSLRLFSCGRLNYVKGHQDLICAVRILNDMGLDTTPWEIAGEDDVGGSGYRKNLEALIMDLDLAGKVSLLGAVSETRVLQGLCNAHIFVLASHHEPLGVAIMEALSCGVPVVATNLGGVPELIDHGIDGYLVSPKDPHVLAEAIRRVASDPVMARAFSNAGRVKIETSFRSDISAVELKRLIESCVVTPT